MESDKTSSADDINMTRSPVDGSPVGIKEFDKKEGMARKRKISDCNSGAVEEEDTDSISEGELDWLETDLASIISKEDPVTTHPLISAHRQICMVRKTMSFSSNSKCSSNTKQDRDGFFPLQGAGDPFWRTKHLLDEACNVCDSLEFDTDTGLYRSCLETEESVTESEEEENIEELESEGEKDVEDSESKEEVDIGKSEGIEEEVIETVETIEEEDTEGELGLLVEEATIVLSGLEELMKDRSLSKVVASQVKVEKIVKVVSGDKEDDVGKMKTNRPTVKIEIELAVSSKK